MHTPTPFHASLLAAALASLFLADTASAQVTNSRGDTARSGVGDCIATGTGAPSDCVPGTPYRTEVSPGAAVRPPVETTSAAALETAPDTDTPGAGVVVSRYATENGIVVDIRSDPVKSVNGDCIHSGTGAVVTNLPECGASFAQVEVVPPTAPGPEAQAPQEPPAAQVQPAQPPPPAAAIAPEPPPLRRITLDTDTTFAFDSAELTEKGRAQLDQVVEAAKDAERMRVHITGYADRIGTDEYNLDLSKRRAATVRNYLASAGLPSEVISVEGRGERNPIVQCEGIRGDALIDCLQPNRRSEVEFAALEPVSQPTATPE